MYTCQIQFAWCEKKRNEKQEMNGERIRRGRRKKKKQLQLFGYKIADMKKVQKKNRMMRARSTVNVNFAFNKIDSKRVFFFERI